VASPVAGSLGTSNTGSLQLTSLLARSNNPTVNLPVTLKFTGSNQYIRSDDVNFANYPDLTGTLPQPTAYNYTAGQAIESNLPVNPTVTPYTYALPLAGWSVTLQGTPKAGDTFLVQAQPTANRNLNAGNASAMMGLRDAKMFDGAALTDGYASLIAQIGIRAQSANYSAEISGSIAANLERDRTGVSGVNLDEEAAKLLQYQQAYQASAKIIQIAQSIFDTLIQTLR
jgi:flagellar hook-associated protein 1 FlgK